MKTLLTTAAASLLLLIGAACHRQQARLNISLSDKFEGKTVELISFLDSIPIATALVTEGCATFNGDSLVADTPLLTQVVIDGRVRAYYVIEPGTAQLTDSMSVATGTPLNDRFGSMILALDSVENLDDMDAYTTYALDRYSEDPESPIGQWFGIEWMKYAQPASIDSLVAIAPASFTDSRRARHYLNFAKLRAATAPGQPYIDFEGNDVKGGKQSFSSLVKPGRYTLVDFWASWCPYCIKEMPALRQLYADWHDKGLDIIGVAVRDRHEDTYNAVKRFEVTWPVLYDTERRPYDIYGFSGIPHHILIGPDGTIVSRDESVAQIEARLNSLNQKE
ncbi:MAG: AhpC/TSA family protein [Muribaculaceae bacterium]|nr:AhpC/TSA family protein [Muribaculaceae bacterium]